MPDGSETPKEESTAPLKEQDADVKQAMTDGMDTEEKDEKSIVAVVENGKVVAGLPAEPKTEAQVAQHIELLLGLVSKVPDLLDE